jgi:2-polyprenyl-3-methyl-5-hydroxy-6-metoxy-1,4-benzoquinol methylase
LLRIFIPELNWSQLYRHRKSIAKRFRELWDIPLEKRYHAILYPLGQTGTSILEIGAGDRSLQSRLASKWPDFSYKSCDIDSSHPHDFFNIDDVTGEFDLICLFEIIEHLSLEQASNMVRRCQALLKPGGRIIVTTPNIYYPPAFMRDVIHCTAWCYDELGGFLELAGLKVITIHRLYHDSIIKRLVRRYLFYPVFRIMNCDYARQIIVVAQKPQ